jgi:porphobilinogen synthase
MTFPQIRMQRLRSHPTLRSMLAEVQLNKADFIAPLFVREGILDKVAVKSMPGVYQHSLSSLYSEAEKMASAGIPALILFGIPLHKDASGTECFNPDGIVQQAIQGIKQRFPHLLVIADCCLCEYSQDGHCGVMEEGRLQNDKTLQILQKAAVSYAESGADIIAPSGMMDGMVGAIRRALDRESHTMTSILSYAVKYASCFYGPFREAGGAGDVFKGDRKHHQMGPTQKKEALREVDLDIEEGADMVMVKPAMAYLDIIHEISRQYPLPVVAYQVSGEYAMLKAGAAAGAFDERAAFWESLIGMKRAGANWIISYYALELAKHL